MKNPFLLTALFAGSVVVLPSAINVATSAANEGIGSTAYEFLDTARLPTHVHDSYDVSCDFDKEKSKVTLTNHSLGETADFEVKQVFPYHYKGSLSSDFSVNVIEDGHLFTGQKCYSQQNITVPLALQIAFR